MFSLNPANIANAALKLAPAVAGPAGLAVVASQTFSSTIGTQILSGVGQAMGLPPQAIAMAQTAFSASSGNLPQAAESIGAAVGGLGDAFSVSAADQQGPADEAQQAVDKLITSTAESPDAKAAKAGGKGQSWLMALAESLGKKLDKMASEMSSMADQITDKSPSMTAKFSAKTQEFGILMNAATNAIKTIGEAEANSARKG